MAEEYCWAITEAVDRSCCGPSGSSELQFGLKMDSLVYSHVFEHMFAQFRRTTDLVLRTVA